VTSDDGRRWNINTQVSEGLTGSGAARGRRASHLRLKADPAGGRVRRPSSRRQRHDGHPWNRPHL